MQLQSGAVCVNDSLVNFIIPDAPMGGRKDSGFGYRHGAEGIRKFCQQKTIVTDSFGLKEEFPWYPASEKKADQVRHLLNLLCHSGWAPQTARIERSYQKLTPLNSWGILLSKSDTFS